MLTPQAGDLRQALASTRVMSLMLPHVLYMLWLLYGTLEWLRVHGSRVPHPDLTSFTTVSGEA